MSHERNGSGRFLGRAFALAATAASVSYAADRYGIPYAVQHGLTPETGLFAARSTNNFWDTIMISAPWAFVIYESTRSKAKNLTRKASLGLSALAMIPGLLCNVASETPVINQTYPMQHVLPPVFRSEPGTINAAHEVNGGTATLASGAVVYIGLSRRRRRDEINTQASGSGSNDLQ